MLTEPTPVSGTLPWPFTGTSIDCPAPSRKMRPRPMPVRVSRIRAGCIAWKATAATKGSALPAPEFSSKRFSFGYVAPSSAV
ncbi:unannotated protein [freshwater metagenome]|uniref:Unannotated protein n=1 Tax=freshwater metagenome TaxID=449393 RepID=A0A6J7IVH6_9ZZZZ